MNTKLRNVLLLFGAMYLFCASTVVANNNEVVIDGFEDGDATDWSFFGGNNAGGGGGVLSDRPYEGTYYLSTGWGGQGSASVFYGGFFRNFDNISQIPIPADPWLNIWVYHQSNTTVDEYILEITLREDTDGDGWNSGTEDSARLDRRFGQADFNDSWTLVSAPLSDFVDLGTGGNGVLEGNLDEMVLVVSGVVGPDGAVVELDIDHIAFSSGGPLGNTTVVFDDMEHGAPFANGWFTFGGSVGGGGISANAADIPPLDGGQFSLETGWGSGGTPGFLGGFGRTNPVDISEQQLFSFWLNPDAGQNYTLEINLQEDDNGDGAISQPDDDEFQYNCTVSPSGPCAISGAGWQRVNIPLSEFFDDNSFLFGGNGVLDPDPDGNGGLINVVWAVISNSGADATFRTDYWVFSEEAQQQRSQGVDDFETPLVNGVDNNGVPLGFITFSDGSPIAISRTNVPPSPVPGEVADNNVLAMTTNVGSFAGVLHLFENASVDALAPQDWSSYTGFRLWVYGQNTGTELFLDILDNRNPGSTVDDAERFTVGFVDNFSGWQQLSFPFGAFVRKEIGNGAPADGFNLTEVNGWAFGSLTTPGELTFYLDNVEIYGTRDIPPLTVGYASASYNITEGDTGSISVALNRPMNEDDPAQISVDYTTVEVDATAGREFTPTSGTLTFVNGGASEQSFPLETFDDSKWEGNERIELRLSNPVDITMTRSRADAYIIENDPYDPALLDDFEDFPYLWDSSDDVSLSRVELSASDAMARPGQDQYEGVLAVTSPLIADIVIEGNACKQLTDGNGNGVIPVQILTTDSFDAQQVDHASVSLGGATETHVDKRSGMARRHAEDVDGDGDEDLVLHFRTDEIMTDCNMPLEITGTTIDGVMFTNIADVSFYRDFAIHMDWTNYDGLRFWYYGAGSDAPVTVTLKDNRAPDPGPAGWQLVWAEEFNEPAGTKPNPENWQYELTDISADGLVGWGNQELQYYTDDAENAATDGQGNMVLTVTEADGSKECYYGPCQYNSARLVSKRRAEFAYGRIEARIKLPEGTGIWPAFWSLGTDIDLVSWPQTGEIDFMEFVGRLPNEIFGTIHGPGYSGGNAYGDIFDFGEPAYNDYHTITVEWQPDEILWFVDGILFHSATPEDVAPNEWVFNDPVYLLLNIAIGGNFGGPVGADFEAPQSMLVDYIRVYQAPDTAERFEASFTDSVAGWQEVVVPFDDFTRSDMQPDGAPDDGLGLEEVWGYGYRLEAGGSPLIDQVRLMPNP